MKVAVFARALTRQPTGRGLYAREMLAALARIPGLELHVFAGEPAEIPGARLYPARGAGRLADAWRILRGIARDVRSIGPDVLWSASPFLPGGLPAGLPAVVTVHDLVWRDCPETMARANRWAAGWMEGGIRRADRIVCDSAFTRDRLAAAWPDRAAAADVVLLAPDPALAEAPRDDGPLARLDLPRPFVVNVGTIEPRKNLPVLLAAMQGLPDVTLVQCGPTGWNVSDVLRKSAGMPNVRRLGYVDAPLLAALYRAASAAVFTTRYEGFHIPPLDAAAAGCPVVASDIPVHREILGDGPVYAPVGDAGAVMAAIRGLIDSPDEARQRGYRLRARAARFGWDASAARLADNLRQAVGTRPARA